MPLLPGKKNVGKNLAELKKANESKPASEKRSRKQMLAIALSKVSKPEKQS